MIHECIQKLREIATFHLVKGNIKLLNKSKYPFKNLVPTMCQVIDDKPNDGVAFQSCNRSLIIAVNNSWLKCKAIGIPYGVSQPVLVKDNIYTYRLMNDPTIGYKVAIWGFHNDPKSEILGMKFAHEHGLPSPEPVGWAEYANLYALDVQNKHEIFNLRRNMSNDEIIKHILNSSKRVKNGCLFCIEESDIRVDEILSAFSYPFIHQIQDIEECSDYIEWLGYSCGYNLKLHHEQGYLHGSKSRSSGNWQDNFMTNSYTGNHVVGEIETWMTDYDMFCKIDNPSLMELEIKGLMHLMNPLFPYQGKIKYKNEFREQLAIHFENGVKNGYNKNTFEIELKLKRNMLKRASEILEEIWMAMGLKKAYIRSINSNFYLDFIKSKKIKNKKLEETIKKLK